MPSPAAHPLPKLGREYLKQVGWIKERNASTFGQERRPARPDGAGVSGSCPAGQKRPDFWPLDVGKDVASAFYQEVTFLYAGVERLRRPRAPFPRKRLTCR